MHLKILFGFVIFDLIANVLMRIDVPPHTYLTSFLEEFDVTYPGLGRFTNRGFWDPIYRPVALLPQSPERINTSFILYTRENRKNQQFLKLSDRDSLENSSFIDSSFTKFIIHGFIDNKKSINFEWMNRFKDEFLMHGDYNVILVDWSGGSDHPYTQATANTRVVGAVVARLIKDLKSVFDIEFEHVHILGHSLGAHIAGYVGEKLKGKLGRITGLDPAGPYFEGLKNPATKLDPTDALFVDVIHTNAKHMIPNVGFGMYETSGHLDFYPNGGEYQPGCKQGRFTSITTEGLAEEVRFLVACNHLRAVEFYISSINYEEKVAIIAHQCEDYKSFSNGKCADCDGEGEKCALFGDRADKGRELANSTIGTRFFLKTSDKYPYFNP